MLVITRRAGESFLIAKDIEVIILATTSTRARIGIVAPMDVRILRSELHDRTQTDVAPDDGARDDGTRDRNRNLRDDLAGGV